MGATRRCYAGDASFVRAVPRVLPKRCGAQKMFQWARLNGTRYAVCYMTSIDSAAACTLTSNARPDTRQLSDARIEVLQPCIHPCRNENRWPPPPVRHALLANNFVCQPCPGSYTPGLSSYFFRRYVVCLFEAALKMSTGWGWMTGWWGAGLAIVTLLLARLLHRVIGKICRPRDAKRSGAMEILSGKIDAKFESVGIARSTHTRY